MFYTLKTILNNISKVPAEENGINYKDRRPFWDLSLRLYKMKTKLGKSLTVWRLQLGPPKNFQPVRDGSFKVRDRSFNKELGVKTSSETVLFFDWLVSILNFSPVRMAYF